MPAELTGCVPRAILSLHMGTVRSFKNAPTDTNTIPRFTVVKKLAALAACTLFAACSFDGTPSANDFKAAANSQLTSSSMQPCLPLGVAGLESSLPLDDSFVIPDSADGGQRRAAELDKVKERAAVLQAAGLLTAEKSSFTTAAGVVPATRYRLTGNAQGVVRSAGLDLCVKAGELVVADVTNKSVDAEVPKALLDAGDVKRALVRTASLAWRNKPQWLSSNDAQLAFAGPLSTVDQRSQDGLRVVIFQHADGNWRAGQANSLGGWKAPSAMADDDTKTTDTPDDLIKAANLFSNRAVAPHIYLDLPSGNGDNAQYRTKVIDGVYFSNQPTSTPQYGLYRNAPQRRAETIEMLETLTSASAVARKPASEVYPDLPEGVVYVVADQNSPPMYGRHLALDLGKYALAGKPLLMNDASRIVEAVVPFTLQAPPAWLVEAAKTSGYFKSLLTGGLVTITARVVNGHYLVVSVVPRKLSTGAF